MAEIPRGLVQALAERYAIESEIGAGGMATVYLARDEKHRRSVAVKVLRPDLAETLGTERFLREIEVAAGLTHPHIVPLYDSGEGGGFLYYVMPFIDGETLRDRLARQGALPVPDAARIFRQIVDALGAAHRHGVMHRDVKPGNVLLASGHAHVADFGVARAVSEAASVEKLTTMGVALGTPQYMAPEQAAADPGADHRVDLFAAGVVAYETLTGVSPFAAGSAPAVFAALLTRDPEPPHLLRPAVPQALSELVMQCLAKDPSDRPQTADELLARLDAAVTPGEGLTPSRVTSVSSVGVRRLGPARVAAVLVALAAASFVGWRVFERRALERWARLEAMPEVLRLSDSSRGREAAELASRVEEVVGPDPVLETVWPLITTPFRAETEPPGAEIWYKPYEMRDAEWRLLGTTPFTTDRFPIGAFRFRIELDGYEPVEEARSFIPGGHLARLSGAGFDYLSDPSYVISMHMTPTGELPPGMLSVSGGSYGLLPISGFGNIAPIDIPPFYIDRTEVTDSAYLEFVEAGAYQRPEYWAEPFQLDGRALGWDEAMAQLLDATGRPGPATWVLGRPPDGLDQHPVAGVSWFEAAAYCGWRGKSLPTLYHWARAALPSSDVWLPFNPLLAERSNLAGQGTVPVGTRDAIGVSGAQDLAGNVREWMSTSAGASRYMAGGSWADTPYSLLDQTPASPWVRLPTTGFRCVLYDGAVPDLLTQSIEYPEQDLSRISTITDAVFEAMRAPRLYDHDQPLLAAVDSSRELTQGVTEEWISVDTPYGERLPVRLHIPADVEPPLQAVVFFPGGNVTRSLDLGPPVLDFIPASGRVLVEPIYEGTFQRNDGMTFQRYNTTSSRTELVVHWIQDLGRTLDYLEARPDIDGAKVAYTGLSFGASLSPNLLPYENRFAAVVLYSGGVSKLAPQSAIDAQYALAQRMQLPLLMLGGRHDFSNPATNQEALFRAFGTPPQDKRIHIIEDAGHWPLPRNEVIRQTADFLDRYLGPVTPKRQAP